MHDIGTLGGVTTAGTAINDSDQVVGWSFTATGTHAFFYNGTMHDIGTLGGPNSFAQDINNNGVIVGDSNATPTDSADYTAFIYTASNGIVDLNALIDPLSGWLLSTAASINDAGQITGTGVINGQSHAFLMNPVPEPSGLTISLSIIACL